MSASRHRALEGVLLRLARQPDREAFALRGGMRVRQLFPDDDRPALDVDLVWCGDVDETEITSRLKSALAMDAGDGVSFGTERVRCDAMHVEGVLAGYRYILRARADQTRLDVMIDVRTDLKVRPVFEAVQVERGSGELLLCRPETILARKLQVIAEAGRSRWRPKDLRDVHRLLGVDLGDEVIERAIAEAFAGRSEDPRPLLSVSWWTEPRARMRWRRKSRLDLSDVVASVRVPLARMLGGAS